MKARNGSEKAVPITTEVTTQDSRTEYKMQIVWTNVIFLSLLHVTALHGIYLSVTSVKLATVVFCCCYGFMSEFGVTAGCHRLWSHRSYKATWQSKLLLAICQASAFQNDILEWSRDHRVHHKFSETDADPHNAKRGFFFSHVGWLMVKKHPDIIEKGKTVDMSDLLADPIVMWQHKYYFLLMPFMTFILPTWITWYLLNEDIWTSIIVSGLTRYTIFVNFTWFVNSAAHLWGNKPYDKNIGPVQNIFVTVLSSGEGWHNYHHVFPWDYKASEFGNNHYNPTTLLVQLFAKIGWAYDMKEVNPEMIRRRALRTGDGTFRDNIEPQDDDRETQDNHYENNLWGWGDTDMTARDKEFILVSNQHNAM